MSRTASPLALLTNLAWASQVAQTVKNLSGGPGSILGGEAPLEKLLDPHSVFLHGEFRGLRTLVGYPVHGSRKNQK